MKIYIKLIIIFYFSTLISSCNMLKHISWPELIEEECDMLEKYEEKNKTESDDAIKER